MEKKSKLYNMQYSLQQQQQQRIPKKMRKGKEARG